MTKQISILFLASAALHAAVLGLVDFDSSKTIYAGSPFRVSIQASSPAPAVKAVTSKQADRPISNKPEPVITKEVSDKAATKQQLSVSKTANNVTRPAEQCSQSTPETTVSVKTTLNEKPESQPANTTIAALELPDDVFQIDQKTASLLQADLNRAFSLHFYYPRLAIKRGWQGEVRLGLRIDADGHLSRIKVLKTSGYALLDKEAVKSLSKVKILPSSIALLNGHSTDLILPVEYRLL